MPSSRTISEKGALRLSNITLPAKIDRRQLGKLGQALSGAAFLTRRVEKRRRLRGFLFRFHREPGIHPRVESALERPHVLVAAVAKLLRHTGA